VKKLTKGAKARKIPIKGEYYELDISAAKEAGKIFRIPKKIVEKAIKNFKYLPHRLEPIGTFRGITFYNDALATIPEATIGALNVLGDKVETIMLGGHDRNIEFKKLAKAIRKSKIKNAILFPTTGKRIWQSLDSAKNIKPFFTDNMKDAVKIAYQNTRPGKICLLSTASASFSIFKDYREKGNLFKKYVREFHRKK
jgi:UDP-N-acetylmuramoylalanine--D-glutamate ligase